MKAKPFTGKFSADGRTPNVESSPSEAQGREATVPVTHSSRWRTLWPWLFSLVALPFLTGCGYHVAGKANRLPPDIQTIAIPTFVNQTPRFRIEQILTEAVTREFLRRTQFRVTHQPSGADAVLKGTVRQVFASAVTFDPSTGRATAFQIQVTADIRLVDLHSHKVLFSNPNYNLREEYQVSSSTSQIFEEDQPALERLSRDLARTLVTDILENF